MNDIKLKTFCSAKEVIDETKRPSTDQEKLFANDISDKGLMSLIIYKQLITQQPKNKLNNKMGRGTE